MNAQWLLPEHWVLWASSRWHDSVADLVDAAATAGFGHVGARFPTLPLGDELQLLANRARGRGVSISVLDAFYAWVPLEGPRLQHLAASTDDLLSAVEVLGVETVNALSAPADLSVAHMAECLATFCDRLADVGCAAHVEFAPVAGGLPDLETAWDVVTAADRPNAGLLVDSWHFFRSGAPWDVLEAIPGERILAVQFADADAEVVGTLYHDTTHHRRPPGDGTFDLPRLVQTLDRIGGLRRIGPEVISDDFMRLPLDDAMTLARSSTESLLRAAARAGS